MLKNKTKNTFEWHHTSSSLDIMGVDLQLDDCQLFNHLHTHTHQSENPSMWKRFTLKVRRVSFKWGFLVEEVDMNEFNNISLLSAASTYKKDVPETKHVDLITIHSVKWKKVLVKPLSVCIRWIFIGILQILLFVHNHPLQEYGKLY